MRINHYFRILIIFTILSLVFLYGNFFKETYVGNLHTHTTCSDGENNYEEMIAAALKLSFKFIAITDHQFCQETIDKCQAEKRIFCIPGQEVTTARTHLVALNTTRPINAQLPFKKQVEEIHSQGGIAIAAHPYLKPFEYTEEELLRLGVDAMECSYEEGEKHPLPCIYTSDAHKTYHLNYQSTMCLGKIKNFTDLKSAILSKNCFRSKALSNYLFKIIPKDLLI